MSARIRWRPLAHQDFTNTALCFAARSESTASRFVDAVQEASALLENHPFAGAVVPEVSDPERQFRRWSVPGFRSYLIFYLAAPDEVEIVRLVHGARDLTPELLGEPPGAE